MADIGKPVTVTITANHGDNNPAAARGKPVRSFSHELQVTGHMFTDGEPSTVPAPEWVLGGISTEQMVADLQRRQIEAGMAAAEIFRKMPKPRLRLLRDAFGQPPFCVVLVGTGKRTMWYGAEIDAMRAAFRGEFTRTA